MSRINRGNYSGSMVIAVQIFSLTFTVVQESRSCAVNVNNEEQFITSSQSTSTSDQLMSNCGSKSHPWRLEAPIGQRINISLLDFNMAASSRDRRDVTTCRQRQYGYIVDNNNNVSICDHSREVKLERESHIFSSESNRLEIVLKSGFESSFLIKVVGK